MSQKLLSKYRTTIIEDFIKIEGLVNAIICKHYLGYMSLDFTVEVLLDELCSSGFKANILEKMLQYDYGIKNPREFADKFRKLSRYRNYFAHCNMTISADGPNFTEDDIVFPPGGIPSPKKPTEFLDVEKIIKDFFELGKQLEEDLWKAIDKMGIIAMENTETKDKIIAFDAPPKRKGA